MRPSCAILAAEEEQVAFIETQLALIERIGPENYIQLQSGAAAEPASAA